MQFPSSGQFVRTSADAVFSTVMVFPSSSDTSRHSTPLVNFFAHDLLAQGHYTDKHLKVGTFWFR